MGPQSWKVPAVLAGVGAGVVVVFLLLSGEGSAARGIAEAINLRARDVPGFVVEAQEHDQPGPQLNARFKRCTGGWSNQHSGSVDASSASFASGSGLHSEDVQSAVTIQSSRSLVAGDLALIRSGRSQDCLVRVLNGTTFPTRSGVPVTINSTQLIPLPTTAVRADGSFAFRVLMTMEALGVQVPLSLDVFGYAVGRDELALTTFAVGGTFPDQTEQRLSQLLVDRALARPH